MCLQRFCWTSKTGRENVHPFGFLDEQAEELPVTPVHPNGIDAAVDLASPTKVLLGDHGLRFRPAHTTTALKYGEGFPWRAPCSGGDKREDGVVHFPF